MKDPVSQFKDAISAAGMQPPEVIKPGEFYRFPGKGKSKSNEAGWCVLFEDGMGGCFGDWSSGLDEIWHVKQDMSLSQAERAIPDRNIKEVRKHTAKEKKQRQDVAAKRAALIWSNAKRAPQKHAYLVRKGIKAHGMRMHGSQLLVPVCLEGHEVISLQFIPSDPNLKKKFLFGSRVKGGYYCLGKIEDAETLCIAEGFATAASIREATGYPVVIAFNTGNLQQVAKTIRGKRPEATIIICADDDVGTKGNPGMTYAHRAARSVGAEVACPDFGDERPEGVTDFNDMATLIGHEAVKLAINAVNVLPP